MKKLQDIGLQSNLLAWLHHYLTQRKQRVVVDGAASTQCTVISGVPQGSVLGPLLFSICINGITETSISVNSYRVLYADDVLLYRGIAEPKEDLSKVQSDIDELERWSEEQLLQMNPS